MVTALRPLFASVSPTGLLVGLLVLFLLGDGFWRLLRRCGAIAGCAPAWSAEALGLRVLLALAAVPWLCIVMDLTTIPITRLTLGLASSVIALVGFVADARPRRAALSPKTRSESAAHATPLVAMLLVLATASLVLFSLIHTSLYPPRTYDALVGYDVVGKIMAYEGRLRSSLFTRIVYNAQCVYAPFTATNQGFWYLFHAATPQLWVPLITAGFALVVGSRVRSMTGSPTASGLATLLMLTPPEVSFHLTIGQTDLPSMVYATLAILATVEFLKGRAGLALPALWALVATSVRSEGILFAMALALACLIIRRARRWRALAIVLPALAFFAFWNFIFVQGLIGYDPGRYFRRELTLDPGRAWEVVRRAAQIIADPIAFGEFVWVIPLGIALWLLGRWGARRNWWGAGGDASVSGPLLALLALSLVCYLPFFYQWDPQLNPLWTMEHTFKRGFFRFVPALVIACVASPPALRLLRRCDRELLLRWRLRRDECSLK